MHQILFKALPKITFDVWDLKRTMGMMGTIRISTPLYLEYERNYLNLSIIATGEIVSDLVIDI